MTSKTSNLGKQIINWYLFITDGKMKYYYKK